MKLRNSVIEVLLSERSEANVHQPRSLWSLFPDWDNEETFSLGAVKMLMTSKPWKTGVGVGGAWLEFASEDTGANQQCGCGLRAPRATLLLRNTTQDKYPADL